MRGFFILAVHFAEDDVDAAENHHGVGEGVSEAHVLEQREVNEGGRTHAVAVRIGAAIADQVEPDLALGTLDATVGFAGFGAVPALLGLGVHDRTGG